MAKKENRVIFHPLGEEKKSYFSRRANFQNQSYSFFRIPVRVEQDFYSIRVQPYFKIQTSSRGTYFSFSSSFLYWLAVGLPPEK
ncbi:hypothetical protein MSLAZ_1363 [Methanosarcina lacustris Z-7289]|uniref:Uncharacterized protein n=1 Tax=Methanosarcina lacustris Z-7289 TaxID=1434111 RepID=A0A0E3S1L9_9EURY|nr:hypothetical protein MSLAZ_1363 [Methanosarcina lacustris Z-7289]